MPPSGLRDNGWETLTSIYDYINIAFANRKKNKLKYAKAKNTAHDWVSQCVPIPLRIQTDRAKKRDWVGKMKRELSYIQFFMDQSQWSTATTDLTRLQHMVLISACHGPFYSYTRPPLTPPRTPSSVLTGCGPQQINDIKMQSWIGHSTCSPPLRLCQTCSEMAAPLISVCLSGSWTISLLPRAHYMAGWRMPRADEI